jgi:succinyl-diaminopimelate desuccinylase
MKILKDEGYKPSKKIRLIMGCDEESGSRCLERYLEKEDRPDLAFSPDADFPLIYGEKGILSYDIVGYEDSIVTEMYAGERYNIVPSMAYFKLSNNKEREFKEFLERKNYKGEIKDGKYIIYGESSHAMDPDKGINAIYLMFEFLFQYTDSKLAEFVYKYYLFDNHGKKADYYDYDEEMKDLTSNLAIIRLENQKFKLGFNVRCPKDDSFDVIPEKVSKIAGIYRYRFEFLGGSKRHYVNRNTELVQKLLKAYQEITNDYSEPITIGGGTYAKELGYAVAFGPQMPGRPDVCHISNEYMRLEDFFNAIKIYYLAIKELTK